MNRTLRVTPNLIRLGGPEGALLLADSVALRPLYVHSGAAYVDRFLAAVDQLGTREKVRRAFPRDRALLRALETHGVVVAPGAEAPPPAAPGPTVDGKPQISLYLLLAQSCNMACTYCLNGRRSYARDDGRMMPRAVACRSVERSLAQLAPGGLLEVIFFGGEPLLNWPLAKEVMAFCEGLSKNGARDKHLRFHLTTNLSFLPPDLIEVAKARNMSFLCDVDGPPEIHDACRPFRDGRPTHAAIADNIRRLADAGLSVALRATITARNQDLLPELVAHHKALGGTSSALVPLNPVNSDEDILPESMLPSPDKVVQGLADAFESRVWSERQLFPYGQYAERFDRGVRMLVGCGAPRGGTPVVDAAGDVYPCIYLVGIPRYYLGNVMADDYPRREVFEAMFDGLRVDRREDCKACPWRYACGGGCPLARLTVLENPRSSEAVKDYGRRMPCAFARGPLEDLLWRRGREAAARALASSDPDGPAIVPEPPRCVS